MAYIEIKNLTKSYGGENLFINLDHKFKKHQFNCIVGRSGIGKTSLLKILMGIDKDFTGEVLGMPANKSVIFQENRLLENHSIFQNINLVLKDGLSHGSMDKYMGEIGLHISSTTKINQLSGGMKRRISILRAVLKESEVYIFDEAFKDMDGDTHELVLRFIKDRLGGKTVIFTSHDPRDIGFLKPDILQLKSPNNR